MVDMRSALDLEPPIGSVVTDVEGHEWRRFGKDGKRWIRDDEDDDPESWVKVAGNYGPVTVIRLAEQKSAMTEGTE